MPVNNIIRFLLALLLLLLQSSSIAGNAVLVKDAVCKDNGSIIIKKNNNIFLAIDEFSGCVLTSSSVFNDLLDSLVRPELKILVGSGDYLIDRPIRFQSGMDLIFNPGAKIYLPSGYDRAVFELSDGALCGNKSCSLRGVAISGAYVKEMEPKKKMWIGFKLKAISKGVVFSRIRDARLFFPEIGILLEVEGDGWVNGNYFQNIEIHHPTNMIVFKSSGLSSKISFNYFENILGQAGPNTKHGVKNILGNGNIFVAVNIWDMKNNCGQCVSASIDKKSKGTIILGGMLTTNNFRDYGVNTKAIDAFSIDGHLE